MSHSSPPRLFALAFFAIAVLPCHSAHADDKKAPSDGKTADGWISLFNGKDLTGWTPKISSFACGENAFDTFRVEDGILKVSYGKYESFDKRYGHLYALRQHRVIALPAAHGVSLHRENDGRRAALRESQ